MIEELVDDAPERRARVLVDFYAAEVPRSRTNDCIQFVAKNFPHNDSFRHLRKVRTIGTVTGGASASGAKAKASAGDDAQSKPSSNSNPKCKSKSKQNPLAKMQLLLCPVDSTAGTANSIGSADNEGHSVEDILKHPELPCPLTPVVVKVPKHPAPNREILQELVAQGAWPQKLMPQKGTRRPDLTEAEKAKMVTCMQGLLLAQKDRIDSGGGGGDGDGDGDGGKRDKNALNRQAALFVDPKRGTVLAQAHAAQIEAADSKVHSCSALDHVVMKCIASIAAMHRERAASTRRHKPDKRSSNGGAETGGDHKRMRVSSGGSSGQDTGKDKDVNDSIKSNSGSAGDDTTSGDYLATGCDVYLSVEPCPMCAMALVHSRVARVIWATPNAARGALGSRYVLHLQPGLNHHYRVFRYHDR